MIRLRHKVVTYITQGERLLVFRHTRFPEAGIQVPAGTMSEGESPEQAAMREAREETGLEGLEVRSYLGVRDVDMSPYGLDETHRRHYLHLTLTGDAPERWLHYENDPSDGSPAPIEFEFHWVRLPEEVPELNGGLGEMMRELKPDTTEPTTAWNEVFKSRGRVFDEPHEDMPAIMRTLEEKGYSTILDLGCGSGRHVLYLAKRGFSVSGLDNSPEGIRLTSEWLAEEGLSADLRLQSMTEPLPYADAFFDAVISVQVIHHARLATIRRTVAEVTRVLKTGGFIFIAVPERKNLEDKETVEIEPGTFVPLAGMEKGLPHHLFSPDELRELFAEYEVTDIHVSSTNHHCLSAFKR